MSRTLFNTATRAKTAVAILTLFTVGSGLNHLYHDVILLPRGQDSASTFESRAAALKKVLPRQGTIGYIASTNSAFTAELCIAQYVLAPVIVSGSTDHDLVLVNTPEGEPLRTPPAGFELARDFGNGLALYKARSRP